MPARETRRIGSTGPGGTRFVSLPMSWCRGTDVKKGDLVEVVSDGSFLIVTPAGHGGEALRLLARRSSA
jgi:hypothetical protein